MTVKTNGAVRSRCATVSSILIVTPNEDAGRSLTVDLAVIDEAYSQRSMDLIGRAHADDGRPAPGAAGSCPTPARSPRCCSSTTPRSGAVRAHRRPGTGRACSSWAADLDADLLYAKAWATPTGPLALRAGPLLDALEG